LLQREQHLSPEAGIIVATRFAILAGYSRTSVRRREMESLFGIGRLRIRFAGGRCLSLTLLFLSLGVNFFCPLPLRGGFSAHTLTHGRTEARKSCFGIFSFFTMLLAGTRTALRRLAGRRDVGIPPRQRKSTPSYGEADQPAPILNTFEPLVDPLPPWANLRFPPSHRRSICNST